MTYPEAPKSYGNYAQDAIDGLRYNLRIAMKRRNRQWVNWLRSEIAFFEILLHD